MAGVYTTKRGKNKKGKLGQRKDASNNAANKLSQKIMGDPLEFLTRESLEPKTLGNSATARKREALENARAKLNLLLTGSCGNAACDKKQSDPTKQLLLCQGCRTKAYCDAVCQKADWKEHKVACKEAQAKKAEDEAAAAAEKKDGKKDKSSSSSSAAAPADDSASPSSASSSSSTPAPAAAAAAPVATATPTPTPAPAASATPATPAAPIDPSALD